MKVGFNVNYVIINNISLETGEEKWATCEKRQENPQILPPKHLSLWLVETRETKAIWPSNQCLRYLISCQFGFGLWY